MAFKEGHALIIGVRSHKFSPIIDVPISYNDAEAVYNILIDPKKCGYLPEHVKFLHDDTATAQSIEDEMDRLAANVKASDIVFFFFAGQSAFGTDNNYHLATYDVQFTNTDDTQWKIQTGTGLSQTVLAAKLKQIKAERALMIFNTCHSGSLQLYAQLPSVIASGLLSTGEGRIVLSACKPNQLSYYFPGDELTFFGKALADGLSGKATPSNGYINVYALYEYIYKSVTKVAKKAMIPQDPMITMLQSVGSFPVALAARSVKSLKSVAPKTLQKNGAVLRVTAKESQKWLSKIEKLTIVMGDYVEGDKVMHDKIDQQINTGRDVFVDGSVMTSDENLDD